MPGYGQGGYGQGTYGGGSVTGPVWGPSVFQSPPGINWFKADTTTAPPAATPVYSNTLRIPAFTVGERLVNFPVRVNLSYLTAGWKAGMYVRGSSTLRVKDQAGVAIPFDLVWSDDMSGAGDLYFKAPIINRVFDTYFTVELVTGATPPAVTDPLGRNAVWSDYDAVFMDGIITNRNGNGNDLIAYRPSQTLSRWFSFAGDTSPFVSVPSRSQWTIGGTYRTDGTAQADPLSYSSSGAYSAANREAFILNGGTTPSTWNSTDGFLNAPSPTYVNGSSERFNISKSASTLRTLYRDGNTANAYPGAARPGGSGNRLYVGAGDLNTVTTGVAGITGDGDFAARQNGSTYVVIPNTRLPGGANPFTIEMWINPTTISTSQGLIGFGTYSRNNESNAIRLGGTAAAPTIINYWWANDFTVNAPGLAVGSWSHLVVTWDGTTRSIYLNNVLLGSNTPAPPNVTFLGVATIGRSYPTEIFSGDIDEVAIYDKALTPAQISAHYTAVSGISYATTVLTDAPVYYYRMGDAANSAVCTDSSGNGLNGIYGAPVEPLTGYMNRIYLRNGVLTPNWVYAERLSWEDPRAFYEISETAPPVVSAVQHVWWDGSTYQPAALRGWWDGSTIKPATVQGQWNGSTIQPIIPA